MGQRTPSTRLNHFYIFQRRVTDLGGLDSHEGDASDDCLRAAADGGEDLGSCPLDVFGYLIDLYLFVGRGIPRQCVRTSARPKTRVFESER